MFTVKEHWLPLALPLLLVGCGGGDKASPAISQEQAEAQAQLETTNIPLTADPIEQIDTLKESIEALEPLSQIENVIIEVAAVPEVLKTAPATVAVSGNYNYDVTYVTPKGVTELNVSFAVTKNVITTVNLTGNPEHETSLQYQKIIQNELGTLVVGKSLTEVGALEEKVNGSSLTPTAFNEALAKLKAEV